MTQQNVVPMTPDGRFPPSIVVGNFKVMHRPNGLYQTTKSRLAHQRYQLVETEHFLLARPPDTDRVTLVHRFLPTEIDNNLVDCLMQELSGLMTTDQAFGHAMIGVVNSIKPHDPVGAWGIFSLNTLRRFREYLDEPDLEYPLTTIGACATIYRRLFLLKVGKSLLDVGCACAFWPALVAERDPDSYERIVGVDNRLDAIHLSQHMAALIDKQDLRFLQLDLLGTRFVEELGTFDTVTAIHILEHLSEEHLLQVTGHRLIVAVPYEQQATVAYGHAQIFTQEKLDQWGTWCVELLEDRGRYWCEDVAGGLLIVERSS